MEPEFLTELAAKTGLETPQIVLSWTYNDVEVPITDGVPWCWDNVYIRRNAYRFPEDVTEGTSILSEAFSATPTTKLGDVTSLTASTYYYYSLFFRYTEYSGSPFVIEQDISRIGSRFYSVAENVPEIILANSDATTNIGFAVVTIPAPIAPAVGFIGAGVEAGFIFEIDDGLADDGFYSILSVDSDTQITLTVALTVARAGNCNYRTYSNHNKFWVLSNSYDGVTKLYRYDSTTEVVDYKIDPSGLLNIGEVVLAIAHAGLHTAAEIGIVTNLRYISFPMYNEAPQAADIVNEWDLDTEMVAGYNVAGAAYFDAGANQYIFVLDNVNYEYVVIDEVTGVAFAHYDLSALDEVDANTLCGISVMEVVGIVFVGNRNYAYMFNGFINPTSADVSGIVYTRDLIVTDFCYGLDSLLGIDNHVCFVSPDALIQWYRPDVGRGYLWQQPYVCDAYTAALYHLDDDGAPTLDSSVNGDNGVLGGMTVEEEGRFGYAYLADAVGENVDVIAVAAHFDGTVGSIEVWHKPYDVGDLSSVAAPQYLIDFFVDANNIVRIGMTTTNLTFQYKAGGVDKVIAAAHPSPTDEFHHYLLTWTNATNQVKAYVDGVQFVGTLGGAGAWAGVLNTATIGGSAANTLRGYYDEVRVSIAARIVLAQVQSYTGANKMYALSGRDYAASYAVGNRQGFHYKDELFTPKFIGGEFFIRNDYEKSQLWPPNKVASDGTILFRDTVLPELGDMGRLCRLVGCILDRIADDRDAILYLANIDAARVSDLSTIAHTLGVPGLDTDNWNVEQQKRYLKHMRDNLLAGGRLVSYHVLAKLLGFNLTESTLYSRRFWDSVVDPERPDVYLDEMGSMDTGDERYPLARLRFKFYKQVLASTGATSIAATRRLTDAAGTFITLASVGSLIRIHDPAAPDDDGDYLVAVVESDTTLIVDRDWAIGLSAAVEYTLSTNVPKPDPYSDYLLQRFSDIHPATMQVEYLTP